MAIVGIFLHTIYSSFFSRVTSYAMKSSGDAYNY